MKRFQKLITQALCLLLGVGAVLPAAGAVQTVSAKTYPLIIMLDGLRVMTYNAQGKDVPALFYNGTNYFPVRTAGEWLGKEVSWDGANAVITLSGDVEPVTYSYTEYASKTEAAYTYFYGGVVDAVQRDDVRILLDGEELLFKNQSGSRVYPLLYRGTTYLPIRNIGELLGMEIAWRNPTAEQAPQVSLYSPMTEEQKTACAAYLSKLTTLGEQYEEATYSLLQNQKDKKKLEQCLDTAKAKLNEIKVLEKPNAAFVADSVAPLMQVVDEQLAQIESAYPLLKTQSSEELFAIEHGQATGILMDLATSPYVTTRIKQLSDEFEKAGLLSS